MTKNTKAEKAEEWDSVHMYGEDWSIRNGEVTNLITGSMDKLGIAIFESNDIPIRRVEGMPESGFRKTLLHEIIHVVLKNSGMCEKILKDPEDQESVVVALENGLFQIFEDNGMWRKS